MFIIPTIQPLASSVLYSKGSDCLINKFGLKIAFCYYLNLDINLWPKIYAYLGHFLKLKIQHFCWVGPHNQAQRGPEWAKKGSANGKIRAPQMFKTEGWLSGLRGTPQSGPEGPWKGLKVQPILTHFEIYSLLESHGGLILKCHISYQNTLY